MKRFGYVSIDDSFFDFPPWARAIPEGSKINLANISIVSRKARSAGLFSFLMLSPSEALTRSGFLYQEILTQEICSIQHGNGPAGFPLGGHLHKSQPPRLARLPVFYDIDRHDIPRTGEKGSEIGFGGLEGKVTHIDFLIWLNLPIHYFLRPNHFPILRRNPAPSFLSSAKGPRRTTCLPSPVQAILFDPGLISRVNSHDKMP